MFKILININLKSATRINTIVANLYLEIKEKIEIKDKRDCDLFSKPILKHLDSPIKSWNDNEIASEFHPSQ